MACWLGASVDPALAETLSEGEELDLGEAFLRAGLTVAERVGDTLELGAEPNCFGAAPKARS